MSGGQPSGSRVWTYVGGMISSKLRAALAAGEHLAGRFWPSGSDDAAAGFISWSDEDGVTIQLVGDRDGPSWPPHGAADQFVLHARTDTGDHLTVLDAWVRRISAFSKVTHITGSTFLLGEHTERDRRWPRALYGTAHLNDWIGETGLEETDHDDGIAIAWNRPPTHELRLPKARGAVTARTSSMWSRTAPHWSIEIEHNLSVDPSRPQTVAELYRRYAMPLLAFTAFVADQPTR